MPDPAANPASCLCCGYDLAALSSRTCPECGYITTDEDLTLHDRRLTYLEVTARVTWLIWLMAALIGILTLPHTQVSYSVVAVMCLPAAALFGSFRATQTWPQLHRKVFRRAWWMSLAYWLSPLLILQLATIVFSIWYWRFGMDRMWTAILGLAADVLALGIGLPLWYYGWRRATRLGGLPESLRIRKNFKRAAVYAAIPILIGVAIVAAAAGAWALMSALDVWRPGWDRGR